MVDGLERSRSSGKTCKLNKIGEIGLLDTYFHLEPASCRLWGGRHIRTLAILLKQFFLLSHSTSKKRGIFIFLKKYQKLYY